MKKFLKKIGGFFVKLFSELKKFVSFLEEHVDDAIVIVGNIRKAVDNPVIMQLMMFLPENLRNQVGEAKAKAILIMEKTLAELLEGEACLQKPTTDEKLQCFIAQLKRLSPAKQEALYAKFASLYAKHSHGAELSQSHYDTAVQSRFFQEKFGIEV